MENSEWNKEEENDHEYVRCNRCREEGYPRYDIYGVSTGYWCDNCYEFNYPYTKDEYHDKS